MNDSSSIRLTSDASRSLLVGKTAAIYYLLGVLGLSFGVPPGYASPIFPSAGFAVAILLYSNRLAWPGIWLGSAILNLWVAWNQGGITTTNALAAAAIATGSTLQAVAACCLLQRFVAGWRRLETTHEVVSCLVLAGPVASLVSASVGVSALCAQGIIPLSAALHAWLNWWSGDTLGVIVVLPLSLAVLYRNEPAWRNRLPTVVLPTLISLCVVSAAYFATASWERDQRAESIQKHGQTIAQLLEQRFIAHQEALSSLRRLIEVMPDMSFRQFEHFTAITLHDNPDIFALSFNSYVPRGARAKYEQEFSLRTENRLFEIKERNADKQLVRAADRADYVSVSYIAPLEGNRPAIGYDINSEPVRQIAIANARASRQPAMTAPIHLVQENQKRVGMLVLHPAYRKARSDAGKEPAEPLLGFAVGVIKADEMIAIATRPALVNGIVFEIRDTETGQSIYRSELSARPGAIIDTWRKQLSVADRNWEIRAWPTDDYARGQYSWITWAVGAAGMVMAALLQVLLLVTTGHTVIVQRKVQEQTQELKLKNEAVEDRNAQLDTLFSLSPDGLVAISPEGIVRFANPAFQSMTGITAAEIVGTYAEEYLDARLRAQMEKPEGFEGVAGCFAAAGDSLVSRTVVLRWPRPTVLQIVGVRSESVNVSRILYMRDITKEAEVDRMKSEFLSHAAHELRTPMASIYGFSELLLEMDLDEATRRDLLETIHRQTRWLVDIINELLDLARIEARQGRDFNIESVELRPLVEKTLQDLSFDPERWPVNFRIGSAVAAVRADRAKLRQALVNVLNNAQKYSPDGGEIEVEVLSANGMTGIAVRDHGIGMTPDQVKRIGERFWRADTSGKIPGTGLGIPIVMEIFQILGGKVDVVSSPNVGTTVTLWLQNGQGQ